MAQTEMNFEQYREYCQEFFTEDINLSDQEISEMSLARFYEWQQQLRSGYSQKRDIIISKIQYTRDAAAYNVDEDDAEKDPAQTEPLYSEYQQYWAIFHNVFDKNFLNREIIKARLDEYRRWATAEQERKTLHIEVSGVSYVAEYRFPVLWHEWECDGYAYVVKVDGQMKLVVSDHGHLYFDEAGILFLQGRITEYNKAIASARQALRSISGK